MRPLAGNKTFRKSSRVSSYAWRVLVVADQTLPRSLADSLAAAGFSLEQPGEPEQAFKVLKSCRFDLVLIDLKSPESSIKACSKARSADPDAGIVMLRSEGKPEDDFRALEAGADDCISAPFRFREMVARMGAALRRNQVKTSSLADTLRAGALELDTKHRRLRRSGQAIHLSRLEYELLQFLMLNRGAPLTHIKLLHEVWKDSSLHDPNLVRFYVGFLRKKIEDDPARPKYILTEPWVGYRFQDPQAFA